MTPVRVRIPPGAPFSASRSSTTLRQIAVPGFLQPLLDTLTPDLLLLLGLYGALAVAYLVVVPLALYAWMVKRWTTMGKLERFGVYGLVFLFFPGLILFAPFINLRMAGQGSR
jgi:NAD(P)H-quinone oxidoreductase subunit L